MPKPDPERKSLKQLIAAGEGLSGFRWPDRCTDFDIRILRDGTWTHRGDPIRRLKLCRLFATALQKDAKGVYWLVTPAERGRITVDDAPFTAVEMQRTTDDQGRPALAFRTNLEHWVTADAAHPIRVAEAPDTGEPSPYIEIRDGLEALIARPVFYDMVARARAVPDGAGVRLMLDSAGTAFPLGRV